MKKSILLAGLVMVLASCGGGEMTQVENQKQPRPAIMDEALEFFKAIPNVAKTSNYDLSYERIALGEMLYMDTRLSKNNTQSCNTCHNVNSFGVDNLPTSPGDLGKNGNRNSPTTFNAALHQKQFWDGRSPDIEDQAGGPILNPVEMNMPSKEYVENRLSGIPEYQVMFQRAFPNEKDPITYSNLQIAIGAFERTLLTPSRFDEFLLGDVSGLNEQEQKGLETFMQVGCTSCHSGALLGGNMFQKFGVHQDYWELTGSNVVDHGKMEVTGSEADDYVFKVPSLRNVEKTGPYFHDGSVNDLKSAIDIMAKAQLNKSLSEQEINDIEAFLNSLTADIL